MKLTTTEAANLILKSKTIFSVTFTKRSTGEVRTMRATLGANVKKGLAGGPAAYDPAQHGLIWVYLMAGDENRDADPKNRRSIPVEGISRLVLGGTEYEVA